MKLNEKIISLREKLNWKQKDLCHASGVSQSELSKIENGSAHNVKIETYQKIATALGITTDQLVPPDKKKVVIFPDAMTDEEAILYSGVNEIAMAKTTEDKYGVFKKLTFTMYQRVNQREDFKRNC